MIWKWYHIHLKEEPFYLPEKKNEKYGLEMEPGVNILVDYVVKRAIKVALVQVLYNQDHLALVMHIVLVRLDGTMLMYKNIYVYIYFIYVIKMYCAIFILLILYFIAEYASAILIGK
jgi:hypothetical protein